MSAVIQKKPCKRGHATGRYKSGACIECTLEQERRRRDTPDYRKKATAYLRKWRKTENGKRSRKAVHFKRSYGITIEQYDEMVRQQGNACAICGRSGNAEFHGRLCVDHNHETKKVRGLLCDNCNGGLGKFLDDPSALFRAIIYLRKFGA
jgi:hypothetical protein